MNGMLDEAKMAATAPQEPVPQQEPQPGTGGPSALEGMSDEAKPVMKQIVETLYEDNFENMVEMFQTSGVQGFGQAMSTAVNGVLDAVEQGEAGQQPPEVIAEVGFGTFKMLLEDMVAGGVVNEQELDKDTILNALQQTLATWTTKNGDREGMDPQGTAEALKQVGAQLGAGGQPQQPGGMV